MNVVTVPNPLKGAAYQVLFETVWPANITSRDRLVEIEAEFARILDWARQTQTFDVVDAYQWAAKEILDGCRRTMAQSELANQVHALVGTIPRAPKMEDAA